MFHYNIMGIEQHKLWIACRDGDRQRYPCLNKKVVFENYQTADISAYGNDWATEDPSEFNSLVMLRSNGRRILRK